MKLSVAALLLTGCSWSSAVKKDVVETRTAEEHTAVEATTVKTQEATQIDTKTTHEESAVIVEEPDGTVEIVRVPAKLPKGSKIQGTVPLSTTATQQTAIVGAKAETAKIEIAATAKVDDKLVDRTETKKKTGASFQVYLIAASLIVAAALCIRFASKS